MKVSVICNTYNRARCLRDLLLALQYQTYPDFEVVVVNGPSTDDTEAVVAEYAGRVRSYSCPKTNLCLSRNIGITAAAGDVVAFMDDDGVPEPQWVEDLVAGYSSPDIDAVGGIVYDHTGYNLEYSHVVCNRLGEAVKHSPPPLTPHQLPHAKQYLHLMGGNSSFKRAKLAEAGGFDEEIEYFLDEAELCGRMIARGFRLVQSDRAAMLHKSAPSSIRTNDRVIRRPFPIVKNKYYFVLQAALRGEADIADALAEAKNFSDYFLRCGVAQHGAGAFTDDEHAQYIRDIENAIKTGTERGLYGTRKSAVIPAVRPEMFLQFPTLRPEGRRLSVCFVSKDLPPGVVGGVGRYTKDVARGMADEGHEIHVITASNAHPTVDFEGGVWVHRVPPHECGPWATPNVPADVARCLGWAAAAHAEVRRIKLTKPVDIVSCPSWDSEGVFCLLDDDLTSVLTVVTTAQTVADTDPNFRRYAGLAGLVDLERLAVRAAKHVTVPSRHMLSKVRKDFGPTPGLDAAVVLPLGTPDRPPLRLAAETDRVRILTVGRLEQRKGTDLFLAAAAVLCPEFPEVEFELVGGGNNPMDAAGTTYRQHFDRTHGGKPWAGRVLFRGAVTEDALAAAYAGCDVFCLPARFESFGLVLTEAMMHGKPVVAAAVGGMADIVIDGRTGFLVYPGSVDSLVSALRRVIDDAGLRSDMGRAARLRYEDEYAGAVVARRTAGVFARVAAGKSAA